MGAEPGAAAGRLLTSFDRSLMTGGDYFDLEAAQACKLFGVQWDTLPRLWFHVLPASAQGQLIHR